MARAMCSLARSPLKSTMEVVALWWDIAELRSLYIDLKTEKLVVRLVLQFNGLLVEMWVE